VAVAGVAVVTACVGAVSGASGDEPDPATATEAPVTTDPTLATTPAVDDAGTRVGFIGLPPEGATPSIPEGGEFVVSIHSCRVPTGELGEIDELPPLGALWVLADGRLIWLKHEDLPEGANSLSTGLLEQRLTPEGVELMRSEATAAFSSDEHHRCGPRDYDLSYVAAGGGLEGNVFGADDEHLARVIDPWSWLPDTAWEDREIRAYVPSMYLVTFGRLRSAGPADRRFPRDQLAAQLPAAAMEVIDTKNWRETDIGIFYATFTTDEARALAAALDDAGLEQDGLVNAYQLDYQFEWHGDPPAVAGDPPVPDPVAHIRLVGLVGADAGCEGLSNLCVPSF
jgi:hypothetical protein